MMMTKRIAFGIGPAGRMFASSIARLADAIEFAEMHPHTYAPSPIHMGDCFICGHLRDDPIHTDGEELK
jgi:hypothetical protein